MDELPRIPTPWKLKWRRLRYRLLPVLTLIVAAMAAGFLWRRHAYISSGTGVVVGKEMQAVCSRDGVLRPVPRLKAYRPLSMFADVTRGQILAKDDDRPIRAALARIRADVDHLRTQLPSRMASATQPAGAADAQAALMAVEVEFLRLKAVEQTVELETHLLDLQDQLAVLDARNYLTTRDKDDLAAIDDAEEKRDDLEERLKACRATLDETRKKLDESAARLNSLPPVPVEIEKQLMPIRAAVSALEARLTELQPQIENLHIRAPITGRITAVYREPGQAVRAGEAIATIVAEIGDHISSYVRQDQGIIPTANMPVDVRVRRPGAVYMRTRVERVGPVFEPVPSQQLRNPRMPEWGLPVRIAMPPGMQVRPGELVEVRFRSNE